MNSNDFLLVMGRSKEQKYLPVAGLLEMNYGFFGYFNPDINDEMVESVILLNTTLFKFDQDNGGESSTYHIRDFNDFLEEFVLEQKTEVTTRMQEEYGKSMPACLIPLKKIVALYPMSKIRDIVKAVEEETPHPTFLDFNNRSVVLKVLRKKIW